jgi:hypothetical protein
MRIAQMINNRIVNYFLLISFAVTLSSCAAFDTNVMTKGPSQRELKFYLKNINKSLAVSNMTNQKRSNFLNYTKIKGERFNELQRDFPQIKGMQVFGIYLKGLTIDREKLDAKYQDIHYLNEQIINKRTTIFVVHKPSKNQITNHLHIHKPSKNQITNHLHIVENTYASENAGVDSVPSSADASQTCQVSQTG